MMYGNVPMVCVWRSEGNFMELASTFNVGSGNQIQTSRLVWQMPLSSEPPHTLFILFYFETDSHCIIHACLEYVILCLCLPKTHITDLRHYVKDHLL